MAKIPTDKLIEKTAALGVPALIFVAAIGATGFAGAAAITTALAALGPGGMIGGVAFLGVAGVISSLIGKYGYEAIFQAVIKELHKKGESKESILSKIDSYHVSKELKLKLKDQIENYNFDESEVKSENGNIENNM